MKTRAVAVLLSVLAVSLLAGSSTLALSVAHATGNLPDRSSADQRLTNIAEVYLNEVLTRPPAGQHQWVELARAGMQSYRLYLPLMLKDAGPLAGSGAEAFFIDPAAAPDPDISGWQVSNQSGGNYTIPDALPPVPAGGFVLIRFDGLGAAADDYSFSDGVAVLHTPAGLVDIFVPASDQVALYSQAAHNPQTIQDFVAYGAAPGEAAADAVAAGLWKAHWWVDFNVGSGAQDASAPAPTNRTTGLYPDHTNLSPDDWAVYGADDHSPGAANPVPRSLWSTTSDGAAMASDGFALGWMFVPGATYQLQIDDDPAFGSPLVDLTLTQPFYQPAAPLPGGLYWWRVRAFAGPQPAAWSIPLRVTVVPVAGFQAPGDEAEALSASPDVVLAMTWLRQRKDNRLLCLDGDHEGNPATTGLEEAWDEVHPDGIYTHGRNSCVRASIAMIVTHYGGSLSMDRIGYYQFENWGSPLADIGEVGNPLRDLGHDRTSLVCGGSGSHGGQMLSWALGGAAFDYDYAKPTFNQVKGWIDGGRPVMRFFNGHQTVIGGYRTLADSTQQIRLFDPWSGTTWENYSSLSITCYYVAPASAPDVRSDEPAIWSDADGDGVMDWDEQNRFHTQATQADSDGDWVRDREDVREYVFDSGGVVQPAHRGLRLRRHAQGNGCRQRSDGSVDGCEDRNRNGRYEAALGETNNFNAASHQACVPIFEILQPTETNPVNAGAHNSPDKILVQVKTATPPSSPVTYAAGDFTVRIGGQDSPVISAYRSLDTHFLVVSPHTQPTADYYDLEVTLGSQVDTETRAVFYLPKLNADQVLVIDRSGSMSTYGKLDAAKNAARAFIDHTNVDDMIGVVSFETSAAVNYGLTTVTGDAVWNAAKAAVNALTTGNLTALGPGTKLGYNEIVAKGKSDHDWSLALLSDGMENVSPYWADPTVGGVIEPSRVVVHTVALGRDADTALLDSIAGATDGHPYGAGVDILPAAAPAATAAAAETEGSAEAITEGSAALPFGPNLPTTLPNRLADIYKAMGEVNGHQQRVWESTAYICEKPVVFELPVEKGLPEAIFTTNWDLPDTYIEMILTDPDGNLIKDNPPKVREIRDATHHQFRVQDPPGGGWKVELRAKGCAHYLFILSARSQTTLHLGFGLPPAERTVGAKIPILAVLSDEKAIAGAEVWALVQGPNSDLVATLQLFDDGRHMDGRPGDGVYGNAFAKALLPGQYVVKATGWGENNRGGFFVRHATGGFAVLPRVAYVWLNDLTTATGYRDLLQAHSYSVTFVPMADVATTQWNRFELVVIGPDTGDGPTWGDAGAVGALMQYTTPILGLGEGGYAFFGKANPTIGYPNGWHGAEALTYAVAPSHEVWHSPYGVRLDKERIVRVYNKTAHVGIQVLRPPLGMLLIGREPADQTHYNLLQNTSRYLLWGFQEGPRLMTEDGRHLFINVARHLAGM
jgi:hypothetical protein